MGDENRVTSGGVELDDELVQQLADEAERGYDTDRLRPRAPRGRPPIGDRAATVFHVRLQPSLRRALEHAADADETTPSDVVRQALACFLPGSVAFPRDATVGDAESDPHGQTSTEVGESSAWAGETPGPWVTGTTSPHGGAVLQSDTDDASINIELPSALLHAARKRATEHGESPDDLFIRALIRELGPL